jgi:hypothetical protein
VFDHQAYLQQNPTQYDAWVGYLRHSAGIIDVDLDHIVERHGSEADEGSEDGLFTLDSDADVLRAVYEALHQAPITFAESDHIAVYYDFGQQIGTGGDGAALTAIQVIVNTNGMDTPADWENAWVSTAYPVATIG